MRNDLRLIPFFSDLPEAVLQDIELSCRREHYAKGDLVFAEGDLGDRMYIIQSGQVKVVSEMNGSEKIFSYLNPGNFFGETALLTAEPRNASVRVLIDSDLISLSRDDLQRLVDQHPALAVQLNHELSRRLTHQISGTVRQASFNLIAVVGRQVTDLARALASTTGEEVFLLDLGGLNGDSLDQAALANAHVQLARTASNLTSDDLPTRLSQLVADYHWVLLALPLYPSLVTIKAIDLADVTVHFADQEEKWLAQVSLHSYWLVPPTPVRIARVARKIAHKQVGLALSSGGARGLAHIGVLEVLQAAQIPIDMIAASSMGAIVGALYAAGRSFEELHRIAAMMEKQTNFISGFSMWDIGIPPRTGLVRGNKTLEYFRQALDNKSFEQLEIPLRIVAADVITGQEVVFDSGPVAEAVRASMSIIGIFEPARINGQFLVDGGTVDPVPTSVLADNKMDFVLASNVIPGLQARQHRIAQQKQGKPPNVISIVLGAMEIMESEIIKTRMSAVDLVISPEMASFSTLDYDRGSEIIELGRKAAAAQLSCIRELLAPSPDGRSTA
jgi:NTE family protein